MHCEGMQREDGGLSLRHFNQKIIILLEYRRIGVSQNVMQNVALTSATWSPPCRHHSEPINGVNPPAAHS